MNIGFIGNSVSAQQDSYRDLLNARIARDADPHQVVTCVLGGIGSLGISFFIDLLMQVNKLDVCFIDTFVADLGGATPKSYIAPALKGILGHKKLAQTVVIPLYLYRSDIKAERYFEILEIYNEVSNSAGIEPINIYEQIQLQVKQGVLSSDRVVYDHVHTTKFGAELYADLIYDRCIASGLADRGFTERHLQGFAFKPLALDSIRSYVATGRYQPGMYRLSLPYIQIDQGQKVEFLMGDFDCIGLIVVADASCGVISLSCKDWNHSVQVYDSWCRSSRIQTIIFPAPIAARNQLIVEASLLEYAPYTANLSSNSIHHRGENLKVIHLMGYASDEIGENKPCKS